MKAKLLEFREIAPEVRLHVSRAAVPVRVGAAQDRVVVEIGVAALQLFEFGAIEQRALVADTVQERELMDRVAQ